MFGLLNDLVRVVAAPVRIVEPVVRVVTKPVADVAEVVSKEVRDGVNKTFGGK